MMQQRNVMQRRREPLWKIPATLVSFIFVIGVSYYYHTVATAFVTTPTSLRRPLISTLANTNNIDNNNKITSSFSSSSSSTTTTTTALSAAMNAHKVQLALNSDNVVRGKLMLIVHKFLVSPVVYYNAISRILDQTFWPEVILIAAMTCAEPITQWLFLRQWWWRKGKKSSIVSKVDGGGDDDDDDYDSKVQEEYKKELLVAFPKSKSYLIARAIRQVGILQTIMYLCDVFLIFLKHMGFQFVVKYKAQQVAASVVFSSWLAYNLSRLKYYYLRNGNRFSLSSLRRQRMKEEERMEQEQQIIIGDEAGTAITDKSAEDLAKKDEAQMMMGFYNKFANRVLDVFIYSCAALNVVDLLGIQIGFAIKSVFGLGSFGTLVLSLASKDVAAEFVGGLMVQSSNFFYEGEKVVLQDGTTGKVLRIGWLHTYIQKEDDFVVRVPNSQISHQRISRMKRQKQRRRGFSTKKYKYSP